MEREEGRGYFSPILSEHRSGRIFSCSLESLWNGAVREHKVPLRRLMLLLSRDCVRMCVNEFALVMRLHSGCQFGVDAALFVPGCSYIDYMALLSECLL